MNLKFIVFLFWSSTGKYNEDIKFSTFFYLNLLFFDVFRNEFWNAILVDIDKSHDL